MSQSRDVNEEGPGQSWLGVEGPEGRKEGRRLWPQQQGGRQTVGDGCMEESEDRERKEERGGAENNKTATRIKGVGGRASLVWRK